MSIDDIVVDNNYRNNDEVVKFTMNQLSVYSIFLI